MLGLLFALALVVIPLVLCAGAAVADRPPGSGRGCARGPPCGYAYALIPLGFGVWLSTTAFIF